MFEKKLSAALTLTMTIAMAIGIEASAQRTAERALLLSAAYSYPFGGQGGDFCVDLTCGQYLLHSYWNAGVTGDVYSIPFEDGGYMQYAHTAALGEWMYRVVSTRNRAVDLYVGGGAFIGYEAYDPFSRLPDDIESGYNGGAFLYGIHARLEAEFFFCRRAAVVLGGRIPINFTSPFGNINYHVSAGLRLNIN